MPQAVERVECKGSSEDSLSSVFDSFRETMDEFNDVCGSECLGRDKVREGIAVEHFERVLEWTIECGERSNIQTLSPTPVTRLAIDPIHVSWGW